jgi:hypothetical protein
MTRALLQQSLDAMQEIYFYILSSNNNLPYKKLQEGIEAITAALAQPEPTGDGWLEATIAWGVCASIHEKFAKGKDALYKKRHADFVKHVDDCRAKATATPPAPEAITYRNPADDVALKRSFDAMENGIVAELRTELAYMTAQRDSWIALMDIAREVYDTTAAKALADMNAADIDADRLDAQRYRWLRTRLSAADFFYSEPPRCVLVFDWPENVAVGGNCDQNVDAALASATGGQP